MIYDFINSTIEIMCAHLSVVKMAELFMLDEHYMHFVLIATDNAVYRMPFDAICRSSLWQLRPFYVHHRQNHTRSKDEN